MHSITFLVNDDDQNLIPTNSVFCVYREYKHIYYIETDKENDDNRTTEKCLYNNINQKKNNFFVGNLTVSSNLQTNKQKKEECQSINKMSK